jgi:hypothetical protein
LSNSSTPTIPTGSNITFSSPRDVTTSVATLEERGDAGLFGNPVDFVDHEEDAVNSPLERVPRLLDLIDEGVDGFAARLLLLPDLPLDQLGSISISQLTGSPSRDNDVRPLATFPSDRWSLRKGTRGLAGHGTANAKEVPRLRHAFEFMLASIVELDPRAGHEIFDCGRSENLARLGEGGDASADMDRDPADLAVYQLALAAVQSRPHLDAKLADCLADCARTPNCSRGAIERCEETVACGVHFFPPKAP